MICPPLSSRSSHTPGFTEGRQSWTILTGEYPLQPGGVSDYTRRVATGLAEAGDGVHVWAPPGANEPSIDAAAGVRVSRLPDCFGSRGLRILDRALGGAQSRPRILVQYVPHAFGYKAMNVGLCAWLLSRRGAFDIWTMFHEVTYPWSLSQPPLHNVLAVVNRAMALMVTRASKRVFVSTTAWSALLRPLLPPRLEPEPLPIPSNVSTEVQWAEVAKLRMLLGDRVLGHFGSFGPHVAPMLQRLLVPILRVMPGVKLLLIGRGAGQFVRSQDAAFGTRMIAAEDLSAEAAANHVAACDLMLQPYPDGATTRRSSLMGALALGIPVVSTGGHLTEAVWSDSAAIALAPVADEQAIVRLTCGLLSDAFALRSLGERGKSLYESRFALRHTVAKLRRQPGEKA